MPFDAHDCQAYAQRVHFLNSSFPVFDFDGTLSVCDDDDLSSPSLLRGKILCLGLNTHNQGIDCCEKSLIMVIRGDVGKQHTIS